MVRVIYCFFPTPLISFPSEALKYRNRLYYLSITKLSDGKKSLRRQVLVPLDYTGYTIRE